MKKLHVDIEICFFKNQEKTQVYPYILFEDNDPCMVFSMVLLIECLKEFETVDEKPGKVNVFPLSTEVLKERVKMLKHQIWNLPKPVERKILNIIKLIKDCKSEYAGIKTYHNYG